MPKIEAFRSLGLFARRGFLDQAACRALVEQLEDASAHKSTIVRDGQSLLDEESRRSHHLAVPGEDRDALRARLEAIRPQVAEHFGLELSGLEDLQFLRYPVGSFFTQHVDGSPDPESPDFVRARKITVVLFLNDELDSMSDDAAESSQGYVGGQLTLHMPMADLFGSAQSDVRLPMPLRGDAGNLIGFPADLVHEVTPVTAGERISVVGWYH